MLNSEIIFRIITAVAFVVMLIIRVYHQSKVLHEGRRIDIREGSGSLIAGSVAALSSILFGAEYVFCPGTFSFAYLLDYPIWLRWLGVLVLAAGITLLASAHHHLGRSFHSLVVSKEDHVLVTSGPYRWVRHPIYTAYLMNYLGGGLLSSNLVLTVVPVTSFAVLVALRMGREEKMMEEAFGQAYTDYVEETGRLLPRLR